MDKKIVNYVKYLRDTSKYFVIPGNMYRCLLPVNNRSRMETHFQVQGGNCYLSENTLSFNDQEVVKKINFALKSDSEKKFFLGIGYVIGKTKKKVFGSLIYLPVEMADNGDLNFDLQDVMINLDLITALLPDFVSFEDFFDNQTLLSIFQNTEDKLREPDLTFDKIKDVTDELIQNLNNEYGATSNFNIKPMLNDLDYNLAISDKNFQLLNLKDLHYSRDGYFLFLNKVPSNISTWKALNNFANSIEEDSFDHNVLSYLFHNVFNQTALLNKVELDNKEINRIVSNLPIDLSEKQQAGLKGCFEYPISYIQGPPGTGKSHSISGIVLAAYFMNKKVLVVSQKNTALNVVKNNILKYFSNDITVPFIYFEKDKKLTLKEDLNHLLEKNKIEEFDSPKLRQEILNKISYVDGLNEELNNVGDDINKILSEMKSFHYENKHFQNNKKNFYSNPVYNIRKEQKLTKLRECPEKLLMKLKVIQDNYLKDNKINKYEHFKLKQIQEQLSVLFNLNVNLILYLKKGLAYRFVENWLMLNHDFYNNQKQQTRVADSQPLLNSLRYNKDSIMKNLKDNSSDLFKEVHSYNLHSSISDKEIFIELDRFKKMLHWNKAETIIERMKNIDFNKILKTFPIWLSEIHSIGEILPLEKEMFDLIIVDESSQVNLAEILPVFYRGKHVCILGDHKQLGLSSVGVNFILSKKSDGLIWDKYMGKDMPYNEGKDKNLIITHSSILEMMISDHNHTSFPSIMLDEHWRCLPGLISFSNTKYYNNKLKIMTEIPDKVLSNYAVGIKVDGERKDKINEAEANKIIEILQFLTGLLKDKKLEEELKNTIPLNNFIKEKRKEGKLTIGIISLLRDQVDYLKDKIETVLHKDIIQQYEILCGTAEEYQGEEKDIIIHSFVCDKNSRNSGHYSDEKRFNVAVSRAKFYNIIVYTDVLRIPIYREYLRHLGLLELDDQTKEINNHAKNWILDYERMDSEFERMVFEILSYEIDRITEEPGKIKFYNQVETIGYRLDFVFYNPDNQTSVAIEVDGRYHFDKGTNEYTNHHKERIDILKKAGWNIINTADYCWYHDGLLNLDHLKTQNEIKRIVSEIKRYLKI